MMWTPADIPDQGGRTAVVTGANSGIGFHAARELAGANCTVVMACRNTTKAEAARDLILAEHPAAQVSIASLNLADLSSVEAFSDQFRSSHSRLDLLVNNAGVMIPPWTRTEQGFELQFGTNHLGHFALTAQLMPLILPTADSRVVTVASSAHRTGRIHFDDLQSEKKYRAWAAYAQSKLANLLFCYELQRRLTSAGHSVRSIAAHPGYTHTNLFKTSMFIQIMGPIAGQSAQQGSWPTLRAATDPDADGGSYWGPARLFQLRGPPVQVQSNARSHDPQVAERLWSVSEALTGAKFDL